MNRKSCRYWNGSVEAECGAGIDWFKTHKNALVCIDSDRKTGSCEHYEPFTEEEIEAKEKAINEHIEKFKNMLKTNKSHCCNADIDESRVIKDGAHKGHGSRYCSKCKEHLFMV